MFTVENLGKVSKFQLGYDRFVHEMLLSLYLQLSFQNLNAFQKFNINKTNSTNQTTILVK